MIRCSRCLYPDTRPDSHFVGGVCSGCWSFDQRKGIDWANRASALEAVLAQAKKDTRSNYDVVVPVSGGKDSTFQVIALLQAGARVLAINAGTEMLSELGRFNLDNLKRFVDVIEVTPNIEVRKKLVRIGLERVGDLSWSEHCAIWSIPTRFAGMMGIPLVVWGEQPQREYSAPAGVEPATKLDSRWVGEFGGMLGLRPSDLIADGTFKPHEMTMFQFPSAKALDDSGVTGIWLGDYIDWDGWQNAFVANQYGWQSAGFPPEGSLANYENLDNHITVLRDYLRFLKFGYGRATDIACNHIRRGRLTRTMGMHLIKRAEVFPQTSLGMPIEEVLEWCGIEFEEFIHECERWMNPDLFEESELTFSDHPGRLSARGRAFKRREDGITPVLKAPGYEL